MTDAISYAESLIDINKEEYPIMMHSRKTLPFKKPELWMKKDYKEDFDVPMECYDEAYIYELVGSFILNQLGPVIGKKE